MAVDSTAYVHPSAIIADGATIGPGCRIGPFCTVGPHVALGQGVILKSHVVLTGRTSVGDDTEIFPFACIGEDPQHRKYAGEHTWLVIGRRNKIREGVTMNTGTAFGTGTTRVGNDCLFMTGAHVGHDSKVGNNVIMANQSALGGHCLIEDNVIIGGLSGVHQNTRIGYGALIGAVSMVRHDVIPFGLVKGPHGSLAGINVIGLRRQGVANDEIAQLRDTFERLFREDRPILENARAEREEFRGHQLIDRLLDFILGGDDPTLTRPPRPPAGAR